MKNNRVSVFEKLQSDGIKADYMDFFEPTVNENLEDSIKKEHEKEIKENTSEKSKVIKRRKKEEEEYVRQTYHLNEYLIQALSMLSGFERRDKSEIVRSALKQYIPERILEQAIEEIKKQK